MQLVNLPKLRIYEQALQKPRSQQDNLKNIHQNYHPQVYNATPRRLELLYENNSARPGVSPYKVLIRELPEISKTTQTIDTALGYPSKLHSKALLLKISHSCQKNLSCCLRFILSENIMQTAVGEKRISLVVPSAGPSMVQYTHPRQNTTTRITLVWLLWNK